MRENQDKQHEEQPITAVSSVKLAIRDVVYMIVFIAGITSTYLSAQFKNDLLRNEVEQLKKDNDKKDEVITLILKNTEDLKIQVAKLEEKLAK